MEPNVQEKFDKVDAHLLEHDEETIAHDRSLIGIRNLLATGMKLLVTIETKMEALIDSETRLYGAMQELAEAHRQTDEAQKGTEEVLRRFIERSGNGRQP